MNLTELPLLATALVEELDRMFPARCIGLNESLREADRYGGKRELIEFLKTLRTTTRGT